jgi:hypothetical protein
MGVLFRIGVGVDFPRIRAVEDPSKKFTERSGHEIRTNMARHTEHTRDDFQCKDIWEHKALYDRQRGCVATVPGRSPVAGGQCTTIKDGGPIFFAQRDAPRNPCVDEDECPTVVPRPRLGKVSIPLMYLCDAAERFINDVDPTRLTAGLAVDLPLLV